MSGQSSTSLARYRSVFISDVHLGFRGCRAEFLLEFLQSIETENLYLVGDIVDLWSLEKSFYWPQAHNNVIRTILGKAMVFGNVEVHRDIVHETADGRRFLVLHGDEFDPVVQVSPLIASLGDSAYTLALFLNRGVNFLRRRMGFPYWSLANYLKHKVKKATTYIANFERALAQEAKRRGLDGTICGHIHRAQVSAMDGVLYCNDGDWVESCTTLTEDFNGRLSLWRWSDQEQFARSAGAAAQPLDQAA
jgi:UDP-2,3-diacylglucosamine pyrophosphatase LpxH